MIRSKIAGVYNSFPNKFWTLVLSSFIDRLGGSLIAPFYALYITEHLQVGMVEVGKLFAVFAISGLVGSTLGGALSDKIGRKSILLFGLFFSAMGSLAMGLVDQLYLFYVLAVVVGILGEIAAPAYQSMVADIVPEEKRSEAYAVLRVVHNLAVTIGPAIGGILAGISYLLLFVIDAVSSTIMAGIVAFKLPETKPAAAQEERQESILKTFSGYQVVLRSKAFMGFMLACVLMTLVYNQMYSTLSVFLNVVYEIPAQGYGYILSLNAGMVVLLQFLVTKKIAHKPPMLMMALGTGFYLVGFLMYGFVTGYALFLLAMILITIGEMIVSPISQSTVAKLAPESMRGRYMAVFQYSYIIPSIFGPLAAGLIMDNYNPNLVWYFCGGIAALAVLGFLRLNRKLSPGAPLKSAPDLPAAVELIN